jgi:hypothetical protein
MDDSLSLTNHRCPFIGAERKPCMHSWAEPSWLYHPYVDHENEYGRHSSVSTRVLTLSETQTAHGDVTHAFSATCNINGFRQAWAGRPAARTSQPLPAARCCIGRGYCQSGSREDRRGRLQGWLNLFFFVVWLARVDKQWHSRNYLATVSYAALPIYYFWATLSGFAKPGTCSHCIACNTVEDVAPPQQHWTKKARLGYAGSVQKRARHMPNSRCNATNGRYLRKTIELQKI